MKSRILPGLVAILVALTAPLIAEAQEPQPPIGEYCSSSTVATLTCVVGAAVVVPVVVLTVAGEAIEAACVGAGGVYHPPPPDGWQWACRKA